MKKINLNSGFTGLIFTIILAFILLAGIFHKTLPHLNKRYFSPEGDGLQSYYTAIYHIRFDSSYHYFNGMNYPFGETTMYSGCQPLISNTIRFISLNIKDISPYTTGIINFCMLFSIIPGAVLLFLIFHRLKIPTIYSSIVSVLIIFASPQLLRICGHYSLTYLFFIPLLIYLLLLFQSTRKHFLYSILIFLTMLLGAFTHAYFTGFFGLILVLFWSYYFINRNFIKINIKTSFLHIFIQLVLAVLILLLYSHLYDSVSDRTSRPYGFMDYRAYPESVFLPLFRPYGSFLKVVFTSLNYISSEAKSYIGLVAVILFIVLFYRSIVFIFKCKFKEAFAVTDHTFLNLLFWTGFAALLYAFGFPFFMGLENLINYIGPLKQLRATGRFVWVFYYIINIIAFYWIWQKSQKFKSKPKRILFLYIPVFILATESCFNFYNLGNLVNNAVPRLDDFQNKTKSNCWVKQTDPGKYQAIIPLPYFQIGSENIGIEPVHNVFFNTCYVSLKTGLPTTAVMLSRTSVRQSLKNIALFLEPSEKPEILKDFHSKKPFLIVYDPKDSINKTEKYLLAHSHFVLKTDSFCLYELPFSVLEQLYDSFSYKEVFSNNEIDRAVEKPLKFVVNSKKTLLINSNIPEIEPGNKLLISFWYSDIYADLNLRTKITFRFSTANGKEYKNADFLTSALFKSIKGKWGLLEFQVNGIENHSRINIYMENDCLLNRCCEVKNIKFRVLKSTF